MPTTHRNRAPYFHGTNCLHLGASTLHSVRETGIEPQSQGAYGPLRPPIKCRIPLWMALNLKLKKKCHIVAPDWLNVGS